MVPALARSDHLVLGGSGAEEEGDQLLLRRLASECLGVPRWGHKPLTSSGSSRGVSTTMAVYLARRKRGYP